jgi:hypothetical protein
MLSADIVAAGGEILGEARQDVGGQAKVQGHSRIPCRLFQASALARRIRS